MIKRLFDNQLVKTLYPVVWNLCLLLIGYSLCRLIFIGENISIFSDLESGQMPTLLTGGARFDWSAICYTNALWILLMLLPFHKRENLKYQTILKYIFILINGIALISNLMDSVYFQFINRRTTASVFSEFKNDNVVGIIAIEIVNHWYLTLTSLALVFCLWRFYKKADKPDLTVGKYYLLRSVEFLVSVAVIIAGIRGGFDFELRPIANRDAKDYVLRPVEANIVLNTPFSICRTLSKKPFASPVFFTDTDEMTKLYSSVHQCDLNKEHKKTNIVIIILESFASEYSGYLNHYCEGKGCMPFLDSLMQNGLTFKHSFANGQRSIDAQVSVLSGIPMFIEPFFTSHAAMNPISSIGGELRKEGYQTGFFHGADNGSLGIEGYVLNSGYQKFYGRNEFNDDSAWDHHWGIWDEEFLQFFANTISEYQQPFTATVFTLTSHHPFRIPERYREVYLEGDLPIYKAIRYSDHALQQFFETASKQPWFNNTLFVLTGDHTNKSNCRAYQTDRGRFEVPVIFYHPTDTTFRGHREGIAQQIDIMPTIYNYLGYSHPYVAFGCDLLNTPPEDTYAVNYQNGTYQYFKGKYLLQFDGEKSIALYDYEKDIYLKENLLGANISLQNDMERHLKAIIQQYIDRMNNNQLVIQ